MKQLDSAGVIVFKLVDGERHYLLLHYPDGHWGFPKGKIELGESKQQAAERELFEETGLHATLIDDFERYYSYIFTDTDGILARKVVHFFLGKVPDNEVKISHEHQDFIWLPFENAVRKVTYDNAKRMLNMAEKFASEYHVAV